MTDNKLAIFNETIQDELEMLFEEAVDLGNCLRRKARQTHRGEKLSASGRILMQTLHLNGPQTVPTLAHTRSTSRQNIQALTDRLEALGHVEFMVNPSHARSYLVRLTARGEAMLQHANAREGTALGALLPHTSEEEIRGAAELLRKLRLLITGDRRKARVRSAKPASKPDNEEEPLSPPADEGLPVTLL